MKRVVVEQLDNSYYFKCTLLDIEHIEIYSLIVHENELGKTIGHMLLPSPLCSCNACKFVLRLNETNETKA